MVRTEQHDYNCSCIGLNIDFMFKKKNEVVITVELHNVNRVKIARYMPEIST